MKRLLPLLSTCLILPALSSSALELQPIGTWKTGKFDKGAAEITQYDKDSQRLFVVNGDLPGIDIIDISDPANPRKESAITIETFGSGVQSVAIHNGLIALAVAGDPSTEPGWIAFFNAEYGFIDKVEVGSLPDMVTFTPDGKFAICANEGEPSADYSIDPLGSISLIEIPADPASGFPEAITLTFEAFNGQTIEGIHAGNPNSSLAQNLEPEYVAVSPDGSTAMVTLQENNAVAIVDLEKQEITSVVGLGYQDRREVAFDGSDKDKEINIRNWPVYGLYQPDSITSFKIDGQVYYAIANEGDARDYDGWSEEVRLADLKLDPETFPNAADLQKKENLGRLKVTNAMGDTDGDGQFEEIYNFGGRSFSILDESGTMIYDSGSLFEEKLAELEPDNFNSNNDENDSFDKRSDDKGPEPEAIIFAEVNGTPLLFVGLERVGGIMVFDVTDPTAPLFLTYRNNRDFDGIAEDGTAGDLGPEGIIAISAEDSPNGSPLLVVSNEISGTVTLYEIK